MSSLDDGVKIKSTELPRIVGFKKSRTNLSLPGTSLASMESLSMPLFQEVVLSADMKCEECQKRVADIMSRLKETESVLINVLEKTVTLTCRCPGVAKVSSKQVATIQRNPLSKIAMIKQVATIQRNPLSKIAMIKRIFRSSRH